MLKHMFGGQETRPVDTASCRGAPEQGLFTTFATHAATHAADGVIGSA